MTTVELLLFLIKKEKAGWCNFLLSAITLLWRDSCQHLQTLQLQGLCGTSQATQQGTITISNCFHKPSWTWDSLSGFLRDLSVDNPAVKVTARRVIYIQLERLGSFSIGYCVLAILGLWNTFRACGGLSPRTCGKLRQKREEAGAFFAPSPCMFMHLTTHVHMFSCWVQINLSFVHIVLLRVPTLLSSSQIWALGLLLLCPMDKGFQEKRIQ